MTAFLQGIARRAAGLGLSPQAPAPRRPPAVAEADHGPPAVAEADAGVGGERDQLLPPAVGAVDPAAPVAPDRLDELAPAPRPRDPLVWSSGPRPRVEEAGRGSGKERVPEARSPELHDTGTGLDDTGKELDDDDGRAPGRTAGELRTGPPAPQVPTIPSGSARPGSKHRRSAEPSRIPTATEPAEPVEAGAQSPAAETAPKPEPPEPADPGAVRERRPAPQRQPARLVPAVEAPEPAAPERRSLASADRESAVPGPDRDRQVEIRIGRLEVRPPPGPPAARDRSAATRREDRGGFRRDLLARNFLERGWQ